MAERRLILMRHAKAERALPGQPDFERDLTERGESDAASMARTLRKRGMRPDRVLVSPAVRTIRSWEIMRTELDETPAVRRLAEMFDAPRGYLPLIHAEGSDAGCLLVVGHNPFIQETAYALSADRSGRDAKTLAEHMPTAGLAILAFDGAWDGLAERTMRLEAFLVPERAR